MDSLKRFWQIAQCRTCQRRIYRSVQPRDNALPLRSYWFHVSTDKRECAVAVPTAKPDDRIVDVNRKPE